MTIADPSSRSPAAARWICVALLLWVMVPGIPGGWGTGSDPSWIWGINNLPAGALPGRDVVFTYGPLGWIFWTGGAGPHQPWLGIEQWTICVVSLAALAVAFRRASLGRVAMTTGFWLLAVLGGMSAEYRAILLLAALAAPQIAATGAAEAAEASSRRRFAQLLPLALLAALSAAAVLVKSNVAASGAVLLVFALLGWRRRGRLRAAVAVTLGASGLVGALAVGRLFGEAANAVAWLQQQAEIVAGHVVAMSQAGSSVELGWALASLGAFVLAGCLGLRSGASTAPLWLAFAGVLAVALRHGFVRQDAHAMQFFALELALLGLLALRARARAELRATAMLAAASVAALGLSIDVHEEVPELVERTAALFSPAPAVAFAAPWRQSSGLRRTSAQRLIDDALPPELLAAIPPGATVDAIPSELAYLPANGLRWSPNPTLQLYVAYTRRLDERVARHFAGAGAPRVLLIHDSALDERNQLWDTPETWRAVLAAYEPAAPGPRGGVLVALRRARLATWERTDLRTESVAVGEWHDLPDLDYDGLLFADVDLRLDWSGRVAAALWRVLPVYLELEGATGRAAHWRLIPGTADGGILMSPVPRTLAQLAALWDGGQGMRPARWRITGPGTGSFEPGVRVRWWSAVLRAPRP